MVSCKVMKSLKTMTSEMYIMIVKIIQSLAIAVLSTLITDLLHFLTVYCD